MQTLPSPESQEIRHELVEVLKTLNWGEEEGYRTGGVEPAEILTRLQKGACPGLTRALLDVVIATLVENQMAEGRDDPAYAWERARYVGQRYNITVLGKQVLLRELDRTDRIA